MRSLVPADSLVYLETNDLAAALQPVVDNKAFEAVAKSKPDFSALKGVQLAVAVTGFETSEEKLTDEHSVGRVQPHFVAVADTHAWNYQAVGFAEKKLGAFVENIYDSEPSIEKTDKSGGKYFTWTAKDGRKAYALVVGGLIYFGNDESAIEKSLAVGRGEADSIAKAGKVQTADAATLAYGYVSTDGIAQIANIVGLKFASETGEDSEVQSAIAGILPQLIRGTITDIAWTSKRGEQGIEDTYQIGMPAEVATVLYETLRPSGDLSEQNQSNEEMLGRIPANVESATRYNFKDPQVALRSISLVAAAKLDVVSQQVLGAFGTLLFEEYGIHDPEGFLRSLGDGNKNSKNIFTAKLDQESDDRVIVAMTGDSVLTQRSLLKGMKEDWHGEDGFYGLKSDDGEIKVTFQRGLVTIGPSNAFQKLIGMGKPMGPLARLLTNSSSVSTIGRDNETAMRLVEMLTPEVSGNAQAVSTYVTETRFTKSGMDRKTTSDFGLIGLIIAQLNEN